MTLPNHIVGGITFTGIFAAFADVNILEKPSYIIIVIFASMLPDIDHTKSLIGKVFYPLAKWINRNYGHRTITHTILFLIIGTLITGIIEKNFTTDTNYSKLFFFGFLSHLIFDMMTVQGVPLFFPFSRNPCVLPANPDKRFRTGNLRTETMIFSFFTISAVFCYPLMQNGFWMQYNRSFGTLTHLSKQFKLSENVLKIEYSYREGSEKKEGSGYVLEASETKTVILDKNGSFKTLTSEFTALKVIPTETNLSLKFQTETFKNAKISDIEQMMADGASGRPLKKLQISSNIPFIISENDIHSETNNYSKEYPNDIRLLEIQPEKIEPFKTNPQIEILKNRIENLKIKDASKQNLYEVKIQKLKLLEQKLETVELSEKELLIKEIRDFKKQIKKYSKSEKIGELELELSLLRKTDAIEKQIYNEENKHEELKLFGTLTKIIIQ